MNDWLQAKPYCEKAIAFYPQSWLNAAWQGHFPTSISLGVIVGMLVGIVGLFLPVVPGTFLIVAGALMLNPQCTWLSRALEKCRMRFPALERAFRRFSTWDKSWQSRFSNSPGDSG